MPGFKMKFSQDDLKGREPVPAGIYDVELIGFKPAMSKNKDNPSVNLNAMVKIVGRPDLGEKRMIFTPLNGGVPGFIQDFVHSFGIPMEDQTGAEPSIPGNFEGTQDDPTTWKYKGPLTGKRGKWELSVGEYNGAPNQEIVKFICAVPQCAEKFPKVRHAKDMRKKA